MKMMNIKSYYVVLYNIMLVILFFYIQQWNICTKNYQFLKDFNDTTNNLSNIYDPTTHLFTVESITIIGAFEMCVQDS